ncbi:MAG: hypothetical protein QOD66_2773 [Solirubrobacteraceae bacterium]|jgi:hypothetical protein|nr:hypothetical protein [Solirubrobacteraceae bacterium]
MLVRAEGLFRLDVVVADDTLRTIVRNLSGDELTLEPGSGYPEGENLVCGEAAWLAPARSVLVFNLGEGAQSTHVDVVIATLRRPDRGTVRISAQAVLRPAASA